MLRQSLVERRGRARAGSTISSRMHRARRVRSPSRAPPEAGGRGPDPELLEVSTAIAGSAGGETGSSPAIALLVLTSRYSPAESRCDGPAPSVGGSIFEALFVVDASKFARASFIADASNFTSTSTNP